MLTTCPECRTTFRLSHAQLEARRGLVRCGYCRAVFNAYDTLLPEFEANPVAGKADPSAGQSADATVPDWDIPPPILPESLRRERKEMPEPDADQAESSPEEGEPDGDAFVLHLSDRVDDEKDRPEATAAMPAADLSGDILLSELPLRGRGESEREGRGTLWSAFLGVLLFLLLLGQLAYFLRGPIVSWLPESRPGLESVCRSLGCRIPLASDAEMIRIEASSLETDPEQPNRATLRVNVSNRSTMAQQWPYLVLKLTDWQGRALAQRAFKPADYLRKDQSIVNGIAALSEQEFHLDLDLTGMIASGYEVVAKYP
ncbi:MAG: DUF3426 domain-containing protein [Thiobacillus sp.]|nr:DUF3426 domain-containing protein [Thiobacillus sp.]